jgi:hypothetical protein
MGNSVPKEPFQGQPNLNGKRNRMENVADIEDIDMEDSASQNGFEEVPTNNTVKLRALNARPIKKIAEAKARNKLKAMWKLAKLQRKQM